MVVELSDLSFDTLVDGHSTWMIDVYAPWCPACRQLEPVWEELARRLPEDIKVGRIDGTKNTALLRRFGAPHYPMLYHVSNRETREVPARYRSLESLKRFALYEWQDVAPRRGCSSPADRCGRVLGSIATLPARSKALVSHLHQELHYQPLTIAAGTFLIPVAMGLAIIGSLDYYYSRATAAPRVPANVQ